MRTSIKRFSLIELSLTILFNLVIMIRFCNCMKMHKELLCEIFTSLSDNIANFRRGIFDNLKKFIMSLHIFVYLHRGHSLMQLLDVCIFVRALGQIASKRNILSVKAYFIEHTFKSTFEDLCYKFIIK